MNSESLFTNCRACDRAVRVDASKCPACGKSQRKPHLVRWIGGAILGLLVLAAMMGQPPAQNTQRTLVAAPDLVTLDYAWRTRLGGSIMEADFVIKNASDVPIKDLRIVCTHYSQSGTRIDSNSETLYQIFPAHSNVTKQGVNMGFIHSQVESTRCVIEKYSPAANS